MRAFLGFPAPETLRDRLEEVQEDLGRMDGLKWVEPENFHLTVKFLGDVSHQEIEDLDNMFQRMLPTVGTFELEVSGLDVFPDLSDPSVAWAGVETNERLDRLVTTVENIAVDCGMEEEDRDYHAHVTLGRVKGELDREPFVEWIQRHGEEVFGNLESDHLILFESELTREGPEYHEINRWPL